MENILNNIKKYSNFYTILGLSIIFYFIFFHNIWAYALMDVDESRYVSMAKDMFNSKDYLTLYLNNEFFFEKPPLYFWGECLSFKIFGQINEFTARFPVALYGTACCFLVYIMGKKIISRLYGVISSLILATSLEFVILAKFAILDIVVTACICFSVCLGMAVYFCRESRKKYYWWLFYLFSGLAVMAKGIPGFIIPFGSMFFISLFSGKFKEIFKPIYFIPGTIIFLLITLPWHIIMLKTYDPLFWNEYILKHHLARFLGDKVINREQPFYFYFITLLWGFFPWVLSCATVWIKNLLVIIREKKINFSINNLSTSQRFILYNSIIALFTLFFFSLSGTKLITYILPIYISLSFIGGYIWYNCITKNEHENIIRKTAYIIGGILLLAGILGIFTPLFLPEQLYLDIECAKTFTITTTFACGLATILFSRKKINAGIFASFVIFITLFSAIGTKKVFEIDYKFGQDDLIEFAQFTKDNDLTLTAFGFGRRYSLIYYGDKPVRFGVELTPEDLKNELERENNLVIVKNKDLPKYDENLFYIIKKGRKYALIEERGVDVPNN